MPTEYPATSDDVNHPTTTQLQQNGPRQRPLLIMPPQSGSSDAPSTKPSGPKTDHDDAAAWDRSAQRWVKRYRVEVAASASSVLSTMTTFPLDSVKTRMQTYQYKGFLDCVRHTYRQENIRGFFRGMSAMLSTYPPFLLVPPFALFLSHISPLPRPLALTLSPSPRIIPLTVTFSSF